LWVCLLFNRRRVASFSLSEEESSEEDEELSELLSFMARGLWYIQHTELLLVSSLLGERWIGAGEEGATFRALLSHAFIVDYVGAPCYVA